jgi:hypothetical protein
MNPRRKTYSRVLACALTAGLIASAAAVNVSAADAELVEIRTSIVPTFSPSSSPRPTIIPLPTDYIPVPTVAPSITELPTALIPLPTVTPVIPSLEPTSGIPLPTFEPSVSPLPTQLIPTTAPTASAEPTATPAPTTAPKPLPDLSGDGEATTSDVRMIMKAIVGKIQFTAEQQSAADLDGDGKLSSVDAVIYLKKVVAAAAAASE